MTIKYTLLSLCKEYDKIEIPRIQRDYAQGREEQFELRNKFVDYLVDSLESGTAIELDFVYGNVREDQVENNRGIVKTFIPIDGQQRLTTLWLLHWFLAVREGRLAELSPVLSRFTYETRPAAHAFCQWLMTESFPSEKICNIDHFIVNQTWFDDEWMNDGTVRGMLRMLLTFAEKSALVEGRVTLDMLLEPQNMISFYFVPLVQFGLSEDLYIRMNARGKILTNFENFKSEFYKIIKDYPKIDQVKDKMEYEWVSNLWSYKRYNAHVIDDRFMNYLKYITRMIYFSEAKYRDPDGYQTDFLNFSFLKTIYSTEEHVDFLVLALDAIPQIANICTKDLLWEEDTGLCDILSNIICGTNLSIDKHVILYAVLLFLYKHPLNTEVVTDNVIDYIRVVRNLICNTDDKSERDQPRILRSIDKLSDQTEIYVYASQDEFNVEGLRSSQCKEEHFKAQVITCVPEAKELICEIEDNPAFSGNIESIIAGSYMNTENDIRDFDFSDSLVASFNVGRLQKLYEHYVVISQNYFNEIWGDMLNSSLYHHKRFIRRMMAERDYTKAPSIIGFAVSFMDSGFGQLTDYLLYREKTTIKEILQDYPDLSKVRNVKVQLYLMYVLTRRVMKLGVTDFFRNGRNIGWLSSEFGYMSLFNDGIDGDPSFSHTNPIFQTYNSQFRYNWGLNRDHAMRCELLFSGHVPSLEALKDWALAE